MAFTDPTVKLTFQGGNVLTENRKTNYGLINAIKESTPFYAGLTPDLVNFINTAQDRTFQMPAIPEKVFTTATTESFTIPSNLNTTETKTATLVTLFTGFHVYNAQFGENTVARDAYIMEQMKNVDKSMAVAKTATTLTAVDGAKTQVLDNNPLANDGITFAASTLTATLAAQQSRIFNNLNVIAMDNGLENDKLFAVSPGIGALQNFNDMYGAANSVDLQNQGFIPTIHVDNRITNTARWTGYLFEKGAFAYVNNFKWDFLNRTKVGEFAFWDISSQPLPSLGEQVMIYNEVGKADASTLQTTTSSWNMTTVEKFGFIHRYLILTPYNSDITSRLNPVIKIVGATS